MCRDAHLLHKTDTEPSVIQDVVHSKEFRFMNFTCTVAALGLTSNDRIAVYYPNKCSWDEFISPDAVIYGYLQDVKDVFIRLQGISRLKESFTNG